jgi:surfactin synthase thioesterase subunit
VAQYGFRTRTAGACTPCPIRELIATLVSTGGLSRRVLEIPELRASLLRTVRSDLAAVDGYRLAPGRAQFASALTAFAGTDNPVLCQKLAHSPEQ